MIPISTAAQRARRTIFSKEFLPTLRPFPKARKLLQHMQASGLGWSSPGLGQTDELEQLLRLCGADQLIQARTSSDDAERSKPDPDIVASALKKIALPAAEVVMLGDTPYDMSQRPTFDVPVIALRCGGWDDVDLEAALAIYDDPADLLENFDSSPLGQGTRFPRAIEGTIKVDPPGRPRLTTHPRARTPAGGALVPCGSPRQGIPGHESLVESRVDALATWHGGT